MTEDRDNQPVEDGRMVRLLVRELRRVFSAAPQMQRRQAIVQSNDVSGYTDNDGVYQVFAKYDIGGGYDVEGMG